MATIKNYRAHTAGLENARGQLYTQYIAVRKGCLGNPGARKAADRWKEATELSMVLTFDRSLCEEQGALNRTAGTDKHTARLQELSKQIQEAEAEAKRAKAELEAAMGLK